MLVIAAWIVLALRPSYNALRWLVGVLLAMGFVGVVVFKQSIELFLPTFVVLVAGALVIIPVSRRVGRMMPKVNWPRQAEAAAPSTRDVDITTGVSALRALRHANGVTAVLVASFVISTIVEVIGLFEPRAPLDVIFEPENQTAMVAVGLMLSAILYPLFMFMLNSMRIAPILLLQFIPLIFTAATLGSLPPNAFASLLDPQGTLAALEAAPPQNQSLIFSELFGQPITPVPTPAETLRETVLQTIWACFLSLFVIWAFVGALVAVILASSEARGMARPTPRAADFAEVWLEAYGVWRGFRRPAISGAVSGVLLLFSTLTQYLGVLLLTVAIGSLLSAVFLWFFVFARVPQVELYIEIGAGFGVAVVLLLLAMATRNGARFATRQGLNARLSVDDRPATLFLRSFQDDQVTLPPASLFTRIFLGEFGKRRLDHILVEHFSRFAPVVALGAPGEKQLPFGAARIYPTHDEWQATVSDLATRAGFVVLIADPSPGVAWEIETFLQGRVKEKVLLLCSPRNGDLSSVPILQGKLAAAEVERKGRVIAHYTDLDGKPVTLRAKGRIQQETYQVALQTYFRDRSAIL